MRAGSVGAWSPGCGPSPSSRPSRRGAARGRADADDRAGRAVGGGPCPWSPGCRSPLASWSRPGRRFARSLVAVRGLVARRALARYQAPPSRGIGRRLIPSLRALGFTYISDRKEGFQMELGPYVELGLYELVQHNVCKAVAVRILGDSIDWVDQYGVYHKITWDPERDAVTITFPQTGKEDHPGPLS